MQKEQPAARFETIYQEYNGRILNLIYRIVGKAETAQDLTQDVFLKAYEHLDTFKGDSQIYTWLYRIAVNHSMNYLKREKRMYWMDLMNQNIGELFKADQIDPEFWGAASLPAPDRVLEKAQQEKIIWKALQALPSKYRVVLILNRYEEMSYQEIADILKINLSAVESRIHRGKKHLIKKLEPLLKHL